MSKKVITVEFQGKKLQVDKMKYRNNRVALELTHKGESWVMATTNLPDEVLCIDEVILKNYSENQGVLDALVIAGVVSAVVRYAQDNRMFPICKLLI